ncbi:hypothetical protein [Corallococcus sicarius]|uniref:Uncharacterized protein n=1 Tax=Corallococcus sicarius TaxID=2316726 RepID=A0A3A8NRV8_9BACT|nr:hypothetical protein [Corallococcus sicarius]RKH47136.1 hypothetical protein D7X12_03670 [Corallococcus sicarius]
MSAEFYGYAAALLAPAMLVVAIIRLALRTDIQLLARRHVDSDRIRYTFALHNAEEYALEGRITIRVEPVLEEGRFMEMPQLLCGPHARTTQQTFDDRERRCYEVVTPRLRALSTWVLHCNTNGKEGDLRLQVTYSPEGAVDGGGRASRNVWVQLGAQKCGRQRSSQGFWMVVGTLLSLLTYLTPIFFRLQWPQQVQEWWPSVDGPFIVLLFVCSALAFWLCRQRPGFIVMGHLGWERQSEGRFSTKDEVQGMTAVQGRRGE